MTDGPLAGKLIALDIDGTLLRSDKSLSSRTVDAVGAAVALGAAATIATGRDWASTGPVIGQLPAVRYSVCINGTEILTADGSMLHALELSPDLVKDAVDTLRVALPGVAIGIGIDSDLVGEAGVCDVLPAGVANGKFVDDVVDAIAPGVRDLLVWHPDYVDDLVGLQRVCIDALAGRSLKVDFSGLPMVEIIPPGAGKDSGLAWLAQHLRLGQADVIAFGDGLNDVAMLQWAGTGVAMGQAPAVVLGASDEVTLSSDEDGVAAWLEARL